MDSSGIGELLATRTALLNRGGQMKLLRPSRRVVEVLQITRIYNTFDIFEDETAALGSFGQTAAGEASAG
ncbi:MAG: STAS domain-containing protein, partial [Bryobacteraceae bacterium]